MKRYGRRAIKIFVLLGIFVCLWHVRTHLNAVEDLANTSVLQLGNAVDYESAKNILGEEQEDAFRMVFWFEEKETFIENVQWYRKKESTVLEICGESSVLFPYSYPLGREDKRGCLIGDRLAWELFGSFDVIGRDVAYKGNFYEIRDVLKDIDIMVVQSLQESSFSYLSLQAEGIYEKDKKRNELQNTYGILLKEVPLYFYGMFIRLEEVILFFLFFLFLWFFLCKRIGKNKKNKKRIRRITLGVGVIGILVGIIYISGISTYSLPNQISNLSSWNELFRQRGEEWKEFRGSEEIYIQKEYRKYLY